MGKFCKCHGLSGSCSMRTCWQSLTSLRLISTQLREKYDAAIEVVFDPSGKPVPFLPKQRAPRRTDLIFYEKSKNFCVPDVTMGKSKLACLHLNLHKNLVCNKHCD